MPEELLLTEECWAFILREVANDIKPYLDMETNIIIESIMIHDVSPSVSVNVAAE